MKYISTRGNAPAKTFTEILLGGPPTEVFTSGTISAGNAAEGCSAVTRPGRCCRFITDIPALNSSHRRDSTPRSFRQREITPLARWSRACILASMGRRYVQGYGHAVGNLFEYAWRAHGLNILGATSGDTGSAAEYAMRGKRGIRVFMLSPNGKMSAFQRAQMYSLQDPN
jgi:threonine synthase